MNTEKLEAFLSLMIVTLLMGMIVNYSNVNADAAEMASEATASTVHYKMDAYETCMFVDHKPDSVCQMILEENL